MTFIAHLVLRLHRALYPLPPTPHPLTPHPAAVPASENSPQTVHYKQYPQENMHHYTASGLNIFLMFFYN